LIASGGFLATEPFEPLHDIISGQILQPHPRQRIRVNVCADNIAIPFKRFGLEVVAIIVQPDEQPGCECQTPFLQFEPAVTSLLEQLQFLARISRYLTDDEFLTMLAAQKLRSGKYRMSANDIVKAVGGDRTRVLGIVRQIREAPAEFKPLTPEQQQVREQLQLDQR
jgi:hypothetical protein